MVRIGEFFNGHNLDNNEQNYDDEEDVPSIGRVIPW